MIWATQKTISQLFDVGIPAISKHLKNIFESGEWDEKRTVSKKEIVQNEGGRNVKRESTFYNLDLIIFAEISYDYGTYFLEELA